MGTGTTSIYYSSFDLLIRKTADIKLGLRERRVTGLDQCTGTVEVPRTLYILSCVLWPIRNNRETTEEVRVIHQMNKTKGHTG